MQNLSNAKSDLQIIKLGSSGVSTITNTNVRATVSGTILEIPVKEGDQVIQANTFNAGTTIATIADLNKMIFEGQVDEGEVGKLSVDMPLIITLGAIEDKEYNAKLRLIAPKGTEVAGAIQFKIEGEVYLDDEYVIRAGYSANASIVTQRKVDITAISESLLQYDSKTKNPYVEIETSDQKFIRKDVKLGISDGVNVELIEGVSKTDKIKVWNKTEPDKRGEVEEED
jgi:HlyD family secretion protein